MYNADRLTAKRGGAFALALLILLLPVMGLAQSAPDPLTITAAWTGADGTPQAAMSVAVTYPQYPNSYWLYVPQEAVAMDAALSITDNYGAYPGGFNLPQGQLLSQLGYVDAGTALNDMPVFFQGLDAAGQPMADFKLFISTIAPTPEPPPEATAAPTPVPNARVTVRYVDQGTNQELMGASVQEIPAGQSMPVYAQPINGYTATANEQTVSVDANGFASPSEVIFYYVINATPTPAPTPVPNAFVSVRYVDQNTMADLMGATAQEIPAGQSVTIYAQSINGYTPTATEQTVTVDANGFANPADIIFYYVANATPVPNAFVTVRYVDQNTNAELMGAAVQEIPAGQSVIVYAQSINGYTPTATEQTVYVDANGIANPAEAIFYYVANATPVPNAVVTVRFVDQNTNAELMNAAVQEIPAGQSVLVYAQSINGYTPTATEQTVYVDANGIANPAEAIFYYVANATPVPNVSVTVRFVDQNTNADLVGAMVQEIPAGQSVTVYAQGIEGYTPTSTEQTVSVDANGIANPAEAIFYYVANATPVPNVSVTVRFVDQNTNAELMGATAQEIPAGQSVTVYAQPINGYTPTATEQTVYVDANGIANPAEAIFYYVANATPVPEPTAAPNAVVTIRYVDQATQTEIAPVATEEIPAGGSAMITAPAIQGYTAVEQEQLVIVDTNGVPDLGEIVFHYTAEPVIVPPAIVTVRYLDQDTQKALLDPATETIAAGESITLSAPGVEGYQSVNAQQTVTVNAAGVADVSEVIFYYVAAPELQPVDIMIHYRDKDGKPVASSQTFSAVDGTNAIKAQPTDLLPGYVLTPPDTQYVIVSGGTTDTFEIVFTYVFEEAPVPTEAPTASPEPAPKAAIVTVFYRDQFGKNLIDPPKTITALEGQENKVQVDLTLLDGRIYAFDDAPDKFVTVDAAGLATPSEIVFLFKDISIDRTAEVTVRYLDEGAAQVSPSQVRPVRVGDNIIEAAPEPAPADYDLISEPRVSVSLAADGTLSQNEVVFTYRVLAAKPTEVPVPTEAPYTVTPMEAYAYPMADTINFRSSPYIAENNVVKVVGTKDLMHITGQTKNDLGDIWYHGTIGDTTGFLKQTVARILTAEEAAAALGHTPVPTASPTPAPTPLVDGVAINRWGTVNVASVNFRSEPSTASKLLASPRKGSNIWIYQQQTANDEKWLVAMYEGREGFVMANYVDLMTQAQSDAMQASLPSPAPVRTLPPVVTPTPAPATPTPIPTATPVPATASPVVTPTPQPYSGYALTTRQVPLSTGVSASQEFILAQLAPNSIVLVSGQAYVGGEAWSHVEALDLRQSGYVPENALRRITPQEAEFYLRAQVTPTPVPTPQPQQVTGFAITLGGNVPMRSYFNTNAEITGLLGASEVVQVLGQEYSEGITWHVVQFKGLYGFIRADQLRMLNAAEAQNYLDSLKTTLPPAVTPPSQLTPGSLSSYGYVNTDKVRLRREPNTNSAYLKMMDRNAFALVLGSTTGTDGNTWYQINQAGTQGYILGSYFTVLPMNQLTTFLQSPGYLNANTNTGTVQTGTNPAQQITAVEDFNTGVWQNPALAQASYEPFNPLGTPTPAVEAILTPTAEGTFSPEPTFSMGPLATELPDKPSSSFPTGLVAVLLIAALGGGGYYAYYMYRQNQQRAAARNAKRRQQQAQQSGGPTTRPAQPQGTSPYQPPRPGTPGQTTPGQMTPGQRPPSGAATSTGGPTPTQGTTAYQPPQGTTPYRPGQGMPQNTTTYRPGMSGEQAPQVPGGTVPYRPIQTPGVTPKPTIPGTPPVSGAVNTPSVQPAPPQAAPPAEQPPTNGESASSEAARRRRRADRHDG